jgi:hypothetical protein
MKTILFDTTTNQPVSLRRFNGGYNAEFPQATLPDNIIELQVIETSAPDYDIANENISSEYVVSGNQYLQTWTIIPKSEQGKIDYINSLADNADEQVKDMARIRIEQEKVDLIRQEAILLTDDEALENPSIYKPYRVNYAYIAGDRFYYPIDNKLYRVNNGQNHTSQLHWPPPYAVSLYTPVTPEGVIAPWVQPISAETAYRIGVIVLHNGKEWQNEIDYNVWEPGVTGWKDLTAPSNNLCTDSPQWSSSNWSLYVVGFYVKDNSKIWRAKNTTHTWIQPALTGDGSISWEFIQDCI